MGEFDERGATVAALVGYVRDLTFWVIQPDPAPWTLERGATYRDSLNKLDARLRKQFDSESEDLRELLGIIKDARDFISILDGQPNLACSAVSEWRIASHVAVFERLKNAEQRMIKRLQKKRGLAIWAAEVLTELARMYPRRMNPQQVANLRLWVGLCVQYSYRDDDDLSTAEVNAVMATTRSLRSFVARAAVAIGFHDWGRLFAADYQSRSDAWEEFAATVENPRRPAEAQAANSSPATIAAPQQGPAAFTGTDSRQPVEWSNIRSPQQWRDLRTEKDLPDGKTWWKDEKKRDPQAFTGTTRRVKITRAKAEEWELELPEFKPHS